MFGSKRLGGLRWLKLFLVQIETHKANTDPEQNDMQITSELWLTHQKCKTKTRSINWLSKITKAYPHSARTSLSDHASTINRVEDFWIDRSFQSKLVVCSTPVIKCGVFAITLLATSRSCSRASTNNRTPKYFDHGNPPNSYFEALICCTASLWCHFNGDGMGCAVAQEKEIAIEPVRNQTVSVKTVFGALDVPARHHLFTDWQCKSMFGSKILVVCGGCSIFWFKPAFTKPIISEMWFTHQNAKQIIHPNGEQKAQRANSQSAHTLFSDHASTIEFVEDLWVHENFR